MKQKINMRLSLVAVIAVIATTLGIMYVFYSIFQTRVKEDLRTNARLLSDTGIFQALYEEADQSVEKIDTRMLAALNSENLRITWIEEDGAVLYDNDTDVAGMENHLDRPEIKMALSEGEGESIRKSDTLNMNLYYYALRLSDGTVLRISTMARSISSVFLTALPVILMISALILVLCVLIGSLLITQLIRPINTMAEKLDQHVIPTVYKELEPFAEKIRSQHEKILEAAKSRQDFTANISHELKTPLTAISGYSELIENRMVEAEQETHIAQEIRHNADRLLSLINDIIRLSELDHNEIPRKFEHVNLYKLAEDTCKTMRVTAENQGISLSCVGTDTMMNGEREMLKELLENLIQNAIRYNCPLGWVRVKVMAENNHAILTVSDSGIGIPYDQQERIFERFYRVDKSRSRATGGTGLGLAIVKHITELHSAEIRLESEPGKGTSISIVF